QPRVDARGGGPSLGDRPHDERLATTGVTGDEHPLDAAHVIQVAPDVPALVELDAQLLDQALALRSREAHRQQHELRGDDLLAAGDLLEATVDQLDLHESQAADVTLVVPDELLRRDRVDPLAALLVRRG